MAPYIFREEAKPKFRFRTAGLLGILVFLLLLWVAKDATVFRLNAAELEAMRQQQDEAERELVFRFMDAPEDQVEERETKFVSDADRIQRSQQQETTNENPDPLSQGDTYELEKADTAPSEPTVAVVTPPVTEKMDQALPEEPVPPEESVETEQPEESEVEDEPTEPAKEVAEGPGDIPLFENAPKPYRRPTETERRAARREAIKSFDFSSLTRPRSTDSASYDNPSGSRAPFTGLTVETSRDDMGAYLKILRQLIKGNWRIPRIARFEVSGVTGISFKIKKDGTIYDVEVIHSSHHEPLDVSALNAVNNTHPAPPLPDHVDEDWVPIKFGFYYNMRPRY